MSIVHSIARRVTADPVPNFEALLPALLQTDISAGADRMKAMAYRIDHAELAAGDREKAHLLLDRSTHLWHSRTIRPRVCVAFSTLVGLDSVFTIIPRVKGESTMRRGGFDSSSAEGL